MLVLVVHQEVLHQEVHQEVRLVDHQEVLHQEVRLYGSPVNTWTDLKLVLENNNPLINLNLYHGNQFRNLLDDAVQVAKTLTKKKKN